MNKLPLQIFEQQVIEETEEIWQQVVTLKKDALKLVQERQKWKIFEDEYMGYFQKLEETRSELIRHRIDLERRIQRSNRSDNMAASIFDPNIDQLTDEISESLTNLKSSPLEWESTGSLQESIQLDFGDLLDEMSEPTTETEIIKDFDEAHKPTSQDNKKKIGAHFRWLYSLQTIEDSQNKFLNDRAGEVERLLDDDTIDEVKLLTHLPFESRDREMWYSLLDNRNDTPSQRLMRFKLWLYLLDLGYKQERKYASDRSINESDKVYRCYLEWQENSHRELRFYFQELEDTYNCELDLIRRDITDLQRKLDE